MLASLQRFEPQALAALRIMTALLFMQHGLNKIFAWPDAEHGPGVFVLFGRVGVAGLLETIGPALLILGLFTRPTAFILCGQMAVAYFWIHAPRGFYPNLNGGELAIMFCFVFMYLFFAGPGAWSLDGAMKKKA